MMHAVATTTELAHPIYRCRLLVIIASSRQSHDHRAESVCCPARRAEWKKTYAAGLTISRRNTHNCQVRLNHQVAFSIGRSVERDHQPNVVAAAGPRPTSA